MLTLNISEVVWTIINFFLLLFLLNKLLYKPVISFREEREARIAAGHKAKADAETSIEQNNARLKAERDETAAKAKLSIANAKLSDDKAYNDVLAAAKVNEPQLRKQIQAEISAQREELSKELEAKQAELVDVLAEHILSDDGSHRS